MDIKRIVKAIISCAIIALAFAACSPKGPLAQVDQTEFNFGEVEQNADVVHAFVLQNKGDQDLLIKKTRSTCGCTVAEPDKKTIKAGQSAEIKVTFKTGRRKGEQNKAITVEVNDPAHPQIKLVMKGTVIERLTFEPKRLRFEDAEAGKELSQTATATNSGKNPITINEIKVNTPEALKVTLDKGGKTDLPITLAAGESLTIKAMVTLPKDKPFFSGRIDLIPADNPDNPVQYYISARQKGAVKQMQLSDKMKDLKAKSIKGGKFGTKGGKDKDEEE